MGHIIPALAATGVVAVSGINCVPCREQTDYDDRMSKRRGAVIFSNDLKCPR